MISTILMSFTLLLAQPATGPSAGSAKITNDQVLQAIDRFLADPKSGADEKLINQFAEESEDCLIALDEKILTWMGKSPTPEAKLMATAFVAGNVRSQLQSHKVADDPYAGLQAVFGAYDKLKEKNKDLSIPEIEKYRDMDKKGELKAHVTSIVQARER